MSNGNNFKHVNSVLKSKEKYEYWEPEIGAWRVVDIKGALEQAENLDLQASRKEYDSYSPVEGIIFGAKDVIDTAGMLTEYGSSHHSGNIPKVDAPCVAQLKQSGAILFGKTVTTEFATRMPGSTRNPINTSHTPGGSSSGSAAAVASGAIPLAIGTQTLGSVIRPAAYCGVPAIKPTKGVVSKTGVMPLSPFFDDIGLFGADFSYLRRAISALLRTEGYNEKINARGLRVGISKTPYWDELNDEAKNNFMIFSDKVHEMFGSYCEIHCEWAEGCQLEEKMWSLISYELNKEKTPYYVSLQNSVSGKFIDLLKKGGGVDGQYAVALYKEFKRIEQSEDSIFDKADIIISPSAKGIAPTGLRDTGSPALNAVWHVTGLPVINVPSGNSKEGMPFGVQIIGPRYQDEWLLRIGEYVYQSIKT